MCCRRLIGGELKLRLFTGVREKEGRTERIEGEREEKENEGTEKKSERTKA